MKLSVDRELLGQALAGVAGIIPARSPKPSRMAVLLSVEGDRCTVQATDGETWIERVVLGATGHEDGRAILPMPRFQRAVQEARGDLAEIEADDSSATVRIGRTEFRMVAFPTSEWLDHGKDFPEGCEAFLVPAPDLRAAFQRTASSTDPNSTNYALGGMHLDLGDGTLVVESYDGAAASSQAVTVVRRDGAWPEPSPVIPEKAASLARKNFPDDDPIGVAADDASIMLRDTRCTMVTRRVHGRFPNWRLTLERNLPPDPTLSATVPKCGDMAGLMAEMAVMTTKESSRVLVRFEHGLLHASVESADAGNSHSAIDCEASDDGEFLICCERLSRILRHLDQESGVTISDYDRATTVLFRTQDGFFGTLAKMYIKQEPA